jgi:hypothetical protein
MIGLEEEVIIYKFKKIHIIKLKLKLKLLRY